MQQHSKRRLLVVVATAAGGTLMLSAHILRHTPLSRLLAGAGAAVLLHVAGRRQALGQRQWQDGDREALEVAELLELNQVAAKPEHPGCLQALADCWGMTDWCLWRDRSNMRALCTSAPDLDTCSLHNLLKFLCQAGVRVAVGGTLLHSEEDLRALAKRSVHRWEFFRHKMACQYIANVGLRSRAIYRIRVFMPHPGGRGDLCDHDAVDRVHNRVAGLLLDEKQQYAPGLWDVDRLYVMSGELAQDLQDAFCHLLRELRLAEHHQSYRRQRRWKDAHGIVSVYHPSAVIVQLC